jgi:hypothetical protein
VKQLKADQRIAHVSQKGISMLDNRSVDFRANEVCGAADPRGAAAG